MGVINPADLEWCYKHSLQIERVTFASGAQCTMCPVCAQQPEFAKAMDEMVELVMRNEIKKGDSGE